MACRLFGAKPLSNYLNLCWIIVNWTPRKKLQWNFNHNTKLFIYENASENIVCKMAAILSRRRHVNIARVQSCIQLLIIAPRKPTFCPGFCHNSTKWITYSLWYNAILFPNLIFIHKTFQMILVTRKLYHAVNFIVIYFYCHRSAIFVFN